MNQARRVCIQEAKEKTVAEVAPTEDEDGKPELKYFYWIGEKCEDGTLPLS
ncbi:MAG: hypothetical protein ABR874_17190 [Candidatus Sulfotelmatobacter sp.]